MAWYERAKAGDRIVCIEGATPEECSEPAYAAELVVGRVYEIKAVKLFSHHQCRGCRVYLDLGGRVFWSAVCFRPAQSIEPGMAILRGLLNTSPADADLADA